MNTETLNDTAIARLRETNETLADALRECNAERLKLIAERVSAPDLLATSTRFVELTNALAVALTPEHIAEATNALVSHCHDARAAIAKTQAP